MAISITEASEDETLMRPFDNLHLGVCEERSLSDRYLLDPIWGFTKEEIDGAGGLGNGGYLSPSKECMNSLGLMSGYGSFHYPIYSSCMYDSKNALADNLWEWSTQERRSSSSTSFLTTELSNSVRWSGESSSSSAARRSSEGKDCFLDKGIGCLSSGGLDSFHVNMFDFAEDKINGRVVSEEVVIQYPKRNEVVLIASSKEGSQYLQGVLAVGDEETVNEVFEGVCDNIFEVMMDQYGQHLFHRTFDVCTVSQQEKLVMKMVSDEKALILSAKNQHGSHTLQKLVKKLKGSPCVKYITSALALDMKSLMISQYGKHVIQQCLVLLDSEKCQVLYEALLRCCMELATDIVGCTSLNNSINNIKSPYRDNLLNILVENSVFLSQDPSGNFVLQYILSLKNPILSKKICNYLQGQFIRLSLHKSGSHLVEKCLKSQGMEYVIIDLLANQKQLLQLARDQFGNYVLQTALRVSRCHDLKMHQFLLQALEPHVPGIKYHPIGRNVFNVISSFVPLPKWAAVEKDSRTSEHAWA